MTRICSDYTARNSFRGVSPPHWQNGGSWASFQGLLCDEALHTVQRRHAQRGDLKGRRPRRSDRIGLYPSMAMEQARQGEPRDPWEDGRCERPEPDALASSQMISIGK